MESLGASLFELRPHTSLSRFKIDRSTKSSRQAGHIIRCSMLDVRCLQSAFGGFDVH